MARLDSTSPPPSPPVVLVVGEVLADVSRAAAGAVKARLAPGGAPANVAVGLARLGMGARFVGRVGDDPLGRWLVAQLTAEGVDVRYVAADAGRPTTLSLITERAGGPQGFRLYWDGTASAALGTDALDPAVWDGVVAAHGGGVVLARPRGARLMQAYYREANARGILTAFDPNVRLALWPDRTRLARMLRRTAGEVAVLKLSAEEVPYFDATAGQAEALLELGPALVAVTQGAEGAVLFTRRVRVTAPAPRVRVVSPVGAGDAFMAGLLAALWRLGARDRRALEAVDASCLARAGRYAAAAGALACRAPGAMAGLPRAGELRL